MDSQQFINKMAETLMNKYTSKKIVDDFKNISIKHETSADNYASELSKHICDRIRAEGVHTIKNGHKFIIIPAILLEVIEKGGLYDNKN